ncbi:amidase [Orrella marina]|uniref:Amidase n=2 Tax=Orrella marina TaxID=2163011 RepID=A0A2R4XM54_9BURK|nr:amidase [Orrella marina]
MNKGLVKLAANRIAIMTYQLSELSVPELATGLQEGRFTSLELVEHYLEEITARNDKLHAFVEVYADEARLAAQAADLQRRSGQVLSCFHGIPIAIKDIADIKGKTRTNGSLICSATQAQNHADVIQNLLNAGFIILGVTHLTEFCANSWGINESMGTPHNPSDMTVARLPGGSSSGSAVALGGNLTPLAIGTDTGGSVRIPAAWCGVVGFKPTMGRISTQGIFDLSQSCDTVGPMARSVRDVALLYDVMSKDNAGKQFDVSYLAQQQARGEFNPWRGARICDVIPDVRDVFSADVLRAYDRTLASMANLGAEIFSMKLPISIEEMANVHGIVLAAEGYSATRDFIQGDTSLINETTRKILGHGKGVLADDYLDAIRKRDRMAAELETFMAQYDAIILPTTMTTSPPVANVSFERVPSLYTRFVNFFDLCGLAFPNGEDEKSLPTSVQLIGRTGEDIRILDLGVSFEHLTRET